MSTKATNRRRQLAWLWLLGLTLVAALASLLPLPYPPDSPDLLAAGVPPLTGSHWLGTDPQGRDVLAGLVFGARTALLISVPAAALATLLGAALGSIAGFWGNAGLRIPVVYAGAAGGVLVFAGLVQGPGLLLAGAMAALAVVLFGGAYWLERRGYRRQLALPTDWVLLAGAALLAAVPLLVLVLTLAALQPPSLPGLLLVLTLTYWPGAARLVRAEVLRLRALPFVEAGRALGLSPLRLLGRHVLPNCWPTLATTFPISIATLIGLETTLSFLGVGLPPETPSWGQMLATVRSAPTAWWLVPGPALAILGTTLALRQLTPRFRK